MISCKIFKDNYVNEKAKNIHLNLIATCASNALDMIIRTNKYMPMTNLLLYL